MKKGNYQEKDENRTENQGKIEKTDPGIFGMLQSVSRKDVVEFLGIHYNSVSRWNADLIRIDAINPDGTLNLLKILRWKQENLNQQISKI